MRRNVQRLIDLKIGEYAKEVQLGEAWAALHKCRSEPKC
jgi:hypothetical protein